MTISPWSMSMNLESPDGRFRAAIEEANEVGMGAPTSGALTLSTGARLEACNPSAVFSDDSEWVAVPQWTRERGQRLLVVGLVSGRIGRAPETYRVLELASFEGGVVRGVDSPIYEPRAIEVPLAELVWEDPPPTDGTAAGGDR